MSTLSKITKGAAGLSTNDQLMVENLVKFLNRRAKDATDEGDDAAEAIATPKRGPGRPRKVENAAPANSSRKPGRPRKVTVEDSEQRPSRKAAKAAKVAKETKPAKVAAKVATVNTVDFSDMKKADLIAAAQKMGITSTKLLRGGEALVKVLSQIQKIANSDRPLSAVEKMASKAGVELKFGAGRPPSDDAGKKRRVLVLLANSGAM